MPVPSFHSVLFVSTLACALALGCGGSQPQVASAESDSTSVAVTPPTAPPAEEAAAEPEATADESAPEAAPAPAQQAFVRSMAERVFSPDMAYMLNYPVSGAREAAEQRCASKFPEPGAEKAACMEKERSKFTADVLVFEKTDKGQTFTIYKRSGSTLAEMSTSKIELGEDTPERLQVKVVSDKGWRPIFAGKKAFDVRAKDGSSIEIVDPQLGALVYEARIGAVGRQ